jgi:hypothetical protein
MTIGEQRETQDYVNNLGHEITDIAKGLRAASALPSIDLKNTYTNLTIAQPQIWLTHLPAGTIDNVADEKIICTIPITSHSLKNPDECYHDSASNQHVFNRKEHFLNYRDISPVRVHGFSKEFETAAVGVGDIIVEGEYGGLTRRFKIRNCLYVPGARANLISQVRLDKVGVSAWFDQGRITLYWNGKPCADGAINKDDMYLLNFHPITCKNRKPLARDNLLVMAAKGKGEPGF